MKALKTKVLRVLTVLTALAALSLLSGCNGKTVIVNWDLAADNGSSINFRMDAEGIKYVSNTDQDARPVLDLKLPASKAGTVLDLATKIQPSELATNAMSPEKGSVEDLNDSSNLNESDEQIN